MGDEILMKKLMILPVLTITLFAQNSKVDGDKLALISEYKNMFSKIKERRIGVEEKSIDDLKVEFIKSKSKKKDSKEVAEKKEEVAFNLQAILNRKAKINGKWYGLNDELSGMKVVAIKGNYVWLKNRKFRKKLILGSKNEKISIK
jgi:hypothetical protein